MPIPGGTDRIVAALDKGEIDAGKNATPCLIQAVLKGSDAVAIIAQTTTPVYNLIVRPEIKSFADLKGKLIDAKNHDEVRKSGQGIFENFRRHRAANFPSIHRDG